MSQQLICDDCGQQIDRSQPYYSGSFQQMQETSGEPTVVVRSVQLDYHVEHSPIPPQLDSLAPATINADVGDVQVHALGIGFNDGSKIVLDGVELATAFVSPADLSCTINGGHGVGESPLLVRRGDQDSNALTFTIVEPPPVESS
jgi:hypothetical protein